MGALGQLYGLKINYYVRVDLNASATSSTRSAASSSTSSCRSTTRATPPADGRGNLKLYMPPGMQRMNGQRALAYARSRHGSTRLRPRGSPAARHHLGARPDRPLVALRSPASSTSSSSRYEGRQDEHPAEDRALAVSLAQELDLDRRENLVLSSRRYGSRLLPMRTAGALGAQGQRPQHPRGGPERLLRQPQGRAHRQPHRGRRRHRACPQRLRRLATRRRTNIADAPLARPG